MVMPLAGSHDMAMLYLATPSLQPLRDDWSSALLKDFIELCKSAKKKFN
jgi:hypothetical protein